jgi:uncharacterized protein DUF4340
MSPTRRLWVALGFGVVAVALFVLVRQGVVGGSPDATPTPQATFFENVTATDITKVVVIDTTTRKTLVAQMQKDGTWGILKAPQGADTGLGIDQARITNALASVPFIVPSRTLSDIESLGTYGLDADGTYEIEFTIKGKVYTLIIGNKNANQSDYYVRRLDKPSQVYLIGTYNLDALIDFVSKPPFIQPTATPGPSPTPTPES